MNCYEGGYVDQLRGACKEAMLVGEGRDASAYRAGARTCRADVEAEREHFENTATSGYIVPDPAPVPEWRRRLTEFRKMASKQISAKLEASGPTAHEFKADEIVYGGVAPAVEAAIQAKRVDHLVQVAIDNGRLVAVADSKPILPVTPNAFADPVPGAKKAKKPKPVDADQSTFL